MPSRAPTQSPVLSLAIIDASTLVGGRVTGASQVLVVVRDKRTNATHPDVVSVPTQRIPKVLFDAVVESAKTAEASTSGKCDGWVTDEAVSGHDPLVFATESLLSRKLGLADALERGSVRYAASVRSVVRGVAVYDNFPAASRSEGIAMINVVVLVTGGASAIAHTTASYSDQLWIGVGDFLAGLARRDPSVMSQRLDPVELCVHGVCLDAAAESLRGLIADGAERGPGPDRGRAEGLPSGHGSKSNQDGPLRAAAAPTPVDGRG